MQILNSVETKIETQTMTILTQPFNIHALLNLNIMQCNAYIFKRGQLAFHFHIIVVALLHECNLATR